MNLLLKKSIFLILLFGAFASKAQIVEDPTTWTFEAQKVKEGDYKLIFHLKLQKGWHIWSVKPGGDGLQIPPTFDFSSSQDFTKQGGVKESGKAITGPMDGVDGNVTYYLDHVDYTQTVHVNKPTQIKGRLNYQVCNDQMCLPPKKKSFSFEAGELSGEAITSDSAMTAAAQADTVGTDRTAVNLPVPASPQAGAPAAPSVPQEKMTPVSMVISGLGNGLLSVITPCVFAMLPMTVSFFLKRSKDRATGVKISLQYSLSIVLIFTLIGGLISAFMGPNTLHAFSTNYIVNLVFFVIFLAFGISFLGAFEINLPSAWATKMDSKAHTRSFIGVFFMALTLVIVSFSCTVPFIGNLVVAIQTGGKMAPLLGFFGFGLGLALPFTLFALFPSLLNDLGKSGGWLNAVKVTFGFVELGLAMKFFSNADLQMHWRILDRELFLAIWLALSLGLSFYLFGFIRFSHDSELPKNDWGLGYLKIPRTLFALTALSFALYLLPGMWGAPLNGMGAFLPPMGTQDFVLSAGGSGGGESNAAVAGPRPEKYADQMKIYEPATVLNFHLQTYYDYEEALAASKALKKPVMLDFTGINCANCRKFESEVWSDPAVLQRMKNDFIVASLFVDAESVPIPEAQKHYSKWIKDDVSTLGGLNVEWQISKFNSNTQPYYFFVDENGTQLADKGISYPSTPEAFAGHLDQVKAKYKSLHP